LRQAVCRWFGGTVSVIDRAVAVRSVAAATSLNADSMNKQ